MNDLREELEASFAGQSERQAETPDSDESFEQWAGRQIAKGVSLEAINLVRLMESNPFYQDQGNQEYAVRRLESHIRNGWSLDVDPSDAGAVLSHIQSEAEAADRRIAEKRAAEEQRAVSGQRIAQLGDLIGRVEKLKADRRKH